MRPHLGQGGCQALEDAAVLGAMVELSADLPSAFSAFESFRRRRVSGVVRESRTIGQLVNLRPALLSAAVSRATVLVPEFLVTRHLTTIAARSAFQLPTRVSEGRARWRWPGPGR
jgi:2-polyprenyl-6-methoxyphenol hydroxylase-like FAD-dependent oxidoreductase